MNVLHHTTPATKAERREQHNKEYRKLLESSQKFVHAVTLKHLIDTHKKTKRRLPMAGKKRIRVKREDINLVLFHTYHQRLIAAIGSEKADDALRILVKELGGRRLRIPSFKYLYRLDRNKQIENLYRGNNLSELAERFQVTKTHICRIMRDVRAYRRLTK